MSSRISKIQSKIDQKLNYAQPGSKDFMEKLTKEELECVVKAKNIQMRNKCMSWLSYICVFSFSTFGYYFLSFKTVKLNKIFSKGILLRPINFAIVGG